MLGPDALDVACELGLHGPVWSGDVVVAPFGAGETNDAMSASPPRVEGDFVYVVGSDPSGVRLSVYDLDGNRLGRLDLPCIPRKSGLAEWLYPPLIAPDHAGVDGAVLVSVAIAGCLAKTSWDPATQTFGEVLSFDRARITPVVIGLPSPRAAST